MRINLTKKDLINLVYMQLGFSKQVSENLIDDFFSTIVSSIKNEKIFGTCLTNKAIFLLNLSNILLHYTQFRNLASEF